MKIDAIIQFLTQKGIDYRFCGDSKTDIIGYSSLKNYRSGTVTWIGRRNAIPDTFNCLDIALAIIERAMDGIVENGIYVLNSKAVFFNLIEHFFETKRELPDRGINCYIGHEVNLGRNVKIGLCAC